MTDDFDYRGVQGTFWRHEEGTPPENETGGERRNPPPPISRARLERRESQYMMTLLREIALRYGVDTIESRRFTGVHINCPQDVCNLLSPEMSVLVQEQIRVLLVNIRNQVVGQRIIYQGNVNSSVVRPAEIYRPAIVEAIPSIIIAHNHPSGDPTPSPEDVSITRDLVAAGKLLGITLLDHVVIGADGLFTSMNERKLGF